MNRSATIFVAAFFIFLVTGAVYGQSEDLCRDVGETPSREFGRAGKLAQYVYGRIVVRGVDPSKPHQIIAIYSDSRQPASRQRIRESGSFCFKRPGNSGVLIIEVDGAEAARKEISDLGGVRQREDFEVILGEARETAQPGVIPTRFARPPNDKTTDLYKKAAAAESEKQNGKAIEFVKSIVAADPADYIAWAKLGSLYLDSNSLNDAEAAFKKAVELKNDYTPAIVNLGLINAVRGDNPKAIEFFNQAITSDPTSARAYSLLGEAYLQNRQGTLGLAALDKALELDPVGMAESHLLKARLYDLVGAKALASKEYAAFLKKVPEYQDKKKLEQYIRDNPEQ